MVKKACRILALVMVLCLLAGCKTQEVTHQTVSVDGFSITIPAQMINAAGDGIYEGWEISYYYGGTEIVAGKEEYAGFEDQSELPSALEYVEWVAYTYGGKPEYVQRGEPAIVHFTTPGETENVTTLAAVYRGSDAYWLVLISCPETAYPDMEAEFMTYLDSVKVD